MQCWGLMSIWELPPAGDGDTDGGTGLGTKAMNDILSWGLVGAVGKVVLAPGWS